ncbi:transglycosylase SLT domain-containing protein [Dongia sp.]|uniref:transglycosylase SLT domain-containing protein n=1 Tax=Dongia sp. TaxID=1977262 RepID=UPI00374FE623
MGSRTIIGLIFGGALFAAAAASPASADDSDLCLDAIALQETQYGMPAGLLKAIARVESSGSPYGDISKPWPWTLNVGGTGHYYPDKEAALTALTAYKAESDVNIDVGCMQISLRHHPNAFPDLATALDPASNVAYGALFLAALHDKSGDWMIAAGNYHSSTPGFGDTYRGLVQVAMTGGRLSSHSVNVVRATMPDGPAIINISQVGGELVIRRLTTMGQPIEGSEAAAAGYGAGCSHRQNQPAMSAGQGVRVWSGVCKDEPDAGSAGNRITIVQP